MGVGGYSHASAALPFGMIRYTVYKCLGGPLFGSSRVRETSLPSGFESRYPIRYSGPHIKHVTFVIVYFDYVKIYVTLGVIAKFWPNTIGDKTHLLKILAQKCCPGWNHADLMWQLIQQIGLSRRTCPSELQQSGPNYFFSENP
jgi:hypothetical protein